LGDTLAWRYFGFNSATAAYVTGDSIQSGQGKWLYVGKNSLLTVKAMAAKPDSLFSIPLSQGWNLIGSPFSFPVLWENSLVRYNGAIVRISDNAAQQLLRRQWFHYVDTLADGINDGQYVTNRDVLLADTTKLLPWNGYWVYAEKSGVELLLNPLPSMQQAFLAKKKSRQIRQWNVRLIASSGSAIDNATVIGQSIDALDSYDKFDSPKPPQLSSDVVAGIVHTTWPHGKTGLFSADIAHYGDNSAYEWLVSVAASGKEALKLTWETTGIVNGTLTLIDSISGFSADMSSQNSYSFTFAPGEHKRLLKVILSPFTGASLRALPTLWSLQQAAPNPFKVLTKIRFSVPVSKTGNVSLSEVTVSVFDIMGRHVRTLVSESKYPGSYSILWNGADDAGKRLRQGVYIVHLSAAGFSGSVKTHLVN
jgi:hypothetical protein